MADVCCVSGGLTGSPLEGLPQVSDFGLWTFRLMLSCAKTGITGDGMTLCCLRQERLFQGAGGRMLWFEHNLACEFMQEFKLQSRKLMATESENLLPHTEAARTSACSADSLTRAGRAGRVLTDPTLCLLLALVLPELPPTAVLVVSTT